jgi:hypothetical protein
MKTLKAESIIKAMILAFFMVMGTCMSANAQQTDNDQNVRQRMSREQLAEVQANHIAKVIGLDEALTKKYVATYCDYQKELWKIGPRLKRNSNMEERFNRSRKVIDIREKYYHKYKEFLTDEQVQKAYNEERRVMRHMKQNKKGSKMKGRAKRG